MQVDTDVMNVAAAVGLQAPTVADALDIDTSPHKTSDRNKFYIILIFKHQAFDTSF
jgi:hypothetical protein